MAKHLITIPSGTALPDVTGLPEGYPFRKDPQGDFYLLKEGVFVKAGGSGGGGVSYGRFLPIDDTTAAMSSVIDGDTPSPTAGTFTPAAQPWGNSNFNLDSWGSANLTSVADSYGGLGSGPRAIPALTTALQVPRFPGPMTDNIMFFVNLPTSGTGITPSHGQAWRVDLVYSLPADSTLAQNSWFYALQNAFEWSDDRSVPGQIGDDDPSNGFTFDDWNDWNICWADGGTTGTHITQSFTVPGNCTYLRFNATISNFWKPTGTDADLGPKIHYLRITPCLDGTANGELFLEQESQSLWLWDTSVGPISGQAGQGWYKVNRGRVNGEKDWEIAVHTDNEAIDLGRHHFAQPMDINSNRLGLAVNDRAPVVLSAAVPVNAAAQDIVMSIAGAPQDTSHLPYVVPPGQDWTTGKVAAFTAIASGNFTASPTLTVNRISGSPAGGGISGTSAAYAPITGTTLMSDASFDAGSGYLWYDVSAATAELDVGDRLEFILHVPGGANAAIVNVLVTLYFGGMAE